MYFLEIVLSIFNQENPRRYKREAIYDAKSPRQALPDFTTILKSGKDVLITLVHLSRNAHAAPGGQ